MSRFIMYVLLAMMLCGNYAGAATLLVPGDYATIQLAISAATTGDTVLVAPGGYRENINFQGKNIVVASHYILAQDTSYIRATIIDGSAPARADSASCVYITSGEDSAAMLCAFTLTGGAGTRWIDPKFPTYTWRGGGGVFIFGSSPTIAHNIITDNTVSGGNVDGAQGGGILCFDGDPLIVRNSVFSNWAPYGAGIAIDYSGARVRRNIICNNEGGVVYGGAAIWTLKSGPAPIIIDNNTIVNNISETAGGAFYIWGSEVSARNNIVWGNVQATGGPVAEAGGFLLLTYSDIEGGFEGAGNINADPLFADDEFNLLSASRCIDSGDPQSPLDSDGTRADMGAQPVYHYDAPYIWITEYILDDAQSTTTVSPMREKRYSCRLLWRTPAWMEREFPHN